MPRTPDPAPPTLEGPTLPPAGSIDAPAATGRVGEYELLSEIARGGMGVVYRAKHTAVERVVALKMSLSGDAERFRREAEAAAHLDHPYVLPVYEVGTHEGRPFFAMKLIEGGTLGDWLKTPRDEPRAFARETARLIALVARAVHYAHQRGILHRDLKPGNILLASGVGNAAGLSDPRPGALPLSVVDVVPYVADFGLAKRVGGSDGLTQTGAILGTPAYMAPEQARADKYLTVAVDVYALGAILYEALAGKPPFAGETPLDTLLQVMEREPARPADADADLATIAMKCLEKDPSRRYGSAEALADDLERWLRHEPIQARPAGVVERTVKWARRRPAIAALLAALALAVGVGVGVGVAQYRRAEREAVAAGRERDDANEQRRIAEGRLAEATLARARAERLAGNRWTALALLAAGRPTPEARREAAEAASLFGIREVAKTKAAWVQRTGGEGPRIRFSADGTLFAINDKVFRGEEQIPTADGVRVFDAATGRTVAGVVGEDLWQPFVFHPTRPAVALGRAGRVVLADPRGGETDLGPGRAPQVFDPAGRRLACASGKADVVVLDLTDGPPRTLAGAGHPAAFDADGGLWTRDADGRLRRWDADGRETAATPVRFVARSWSPDGRLAVLSGWDPPYQAVVWDLARGVKSADLPAGGTGASVLAQPFAPAGDLLAFPRAAEPWGMGVFSLADRQVRAWLPAGDPNSPGVRYAAFSPDGTILAVDVEHGGDLRLWDTATGQLLTTLSQHSEPAWSPDGRYLAATCGIGWAAQENIENSYSKSAASHVRVYEVAYGPAVDRSPSPVRGLTFAPDGSALAGGGRFWRVERVAGRRVLRRDGLVADGHSAFFDPAGGRRSFPVEQWPKPLAPVPLTRAGGPVIEFPGRPDHGWPNQPNAGRYRDIAVLPGGRRAVAIWEGYAPPEPGRDSRTTESRVECWDLDGPKLVATWHQGSGQYLGLAVSRDGSKVAAHGYASLAVWDAATGRKLSGQTGGSSPPGVAWTSAGRLLAGTAEGNVIVYEVEPWREAARWKAHVGEVIAVAVNDALIATSDGGDIALWDAATRAERARWSAGLANVVGLAFHPDSMALAVADARGFVRLWDIPALRAGMMSANLGW
ncbi:MAG: serine/threonine-protein kinase [Gemmataceae bacterium]